MISSSRTSPLIPLDKSHPLPEKEKRRTFPQEAKSYSDCYFPWIGEMLRNSFYLPLHDLDTTHLSEVNIGLEDPHFYEKNTAKYLQVFTKMFKGEQEGVDPTFTSFARFKDAFTVTDTPIEIKEDGITYICNIRSVQSNNFEEGSQGLRFIFFSFNENTQKEGDKVSSWDPKSLDAVGQLPLKVLQAMQKKMTIDSLMCFSLGSLTLDVLRDVDQDVLPETIIIDRGLTSIKKVAPRVVPYPISTILHYLASWYHLDANPENGFPSHLEKITPLKNKKVVLIQAAVDNYFSGDSGYSEDYIDRIKKTGAEVLHGSFLVPYTAERAHHALRKDWIIKTPGADVENFIPIEAHERLSDALSNYLTKDSSHTCFFVGGNKDNLDSMLYGCAPVLESYLKGVFIIK